MRKTIILVSSAVVTSFLFTGCATLFGGGANQAINIQSSKTQTVDVYKVKTKKDEENGEVKVVGEDLIHSNIQVPSSVNVNRDTKDILIKSKDGECKEKKVEKKLNPWFWGDVVATSLVSTTTDAVTGAMWKYDENVSLDCN
jgi:hypothetical protein